MKKNIVASSFFLMIVIGLFLTLLMSCSDEIPLYMVRFDSQGGSVVSAKEAFKGSRITEPAAPARANHEFGGWFKDSSCVDAWNFKSDTVTSDITLYAKWTPAYTVFFDSQGGGSISSMEEVSQGSGISEPIPPTRNGYSFDGWYKDSSCVDAWNFDSDTVTSDITLYAKWVPAYTVFFDSQGGSKIAPLEGIRQGSKITEPTAPTRNGYDFNGWYKDSECTIEWKFGSDIVETSWTLYAKWVVALYSVNFDSLGGTVVPTNEDIEYGAKIREPVSPTRDEYLFDGWYLDSSCTNRWYFTTDTVTSNLTLYAKWLSPHTVAFNSQGGTSVPSINDVGHGNKINEPISPTRSGSVFDGWYLESTCINQWDFTTDIVTSNLTLYAKWLGPYTVVFNSQEGTIVPTFDDVEHGTKVNEPVPPTRRGYLFDGWYLDDSCTNRWYFNTDTVTSNLTLYAKWLPLHLVSFNSQGGSGIHAIEVEYGKKLNVPESPTKSGYIFDGWYLESSSINRWDFLKNVTSNMILYAKWIPQYTVFFDSQGGTTPDPDSVTVIYKQAYGELPTVTKEGYTFGGWWTGIQGTGTEIQAMTVVSITNDQTLYAKWIPQYTVFFDSQGGTQPEPISKSVTYHQIYGSYNNPLPFVTRSGYTFAGWWTEEGGKGEQVRWYTTVSITSNQTLYAKWIPQYTVTFNSQSGSIPSPSCKIVTYDKPYGTLPTVTRSGYTFGGWWTGTQGTGTEIQATTEVSITSNQTLYAKWSVNSYTVSFDNQGGSNPNSENKIVTYDQTYGTLPSVSRIGYTFGGWWTGIQGKGTEIQATTVVSITSNQTLYAKWSGNSYIVSFDSQGGSNPNPVDKIVTYDQTYGTLPSVSRSEYTFGGWWTGEGGTGSQIHAANVVSITNDQILYAKWNIISYGPSGGIVFYDKGSYSDGWRYLEAAPANWSGRYEDPKYIFGYHRTSSNGSNMTVETGGGIGSGKENTQKLVGAMGSSAYSTSNESTTTAAYAAKVCADLEIANDGVLYNDWFLPSKNELNLMYQNLKMEELGRFSRDIYWSSSEYNTNDVWFHCFASGYPSAADRYYKLRVRPVRAF